MAEHTPGPWEIRQYTNYYGYSIDAEGRGCIAERWYDLPQDQPYGNEIPANARLISAAPDLLEACKKAVRELNEIRARDGVPYNQWGMKSSVTPEHFSSVVDECFAAIAKATGNN
jgi:hypothetical protein